MKSIIILFLTTLKLLSYSQTTTIDAFNPLDEIRILAFENKDFEAAIVLTEHYLISEPDNFDYKHMLFNLNKWSKKYEVALVLANEFIKSDSLNRYYYIQKLNILEEMALFDKSLQAIMKILEIFPDDEYFLFRQAFSLSKLNRINQSISLLEEILKNNPKHTDAEYLLDQLKIAKNKNVIVLGYYNLISSLDQSSTKFYNIAYGRKINKHTFVATLNSNRWNQNPGFEFSLSNYYKINDTDYSMLGIAHSRSLFFPKFRITGSYYHALDEKYEASLSSNYIITNEGNLSIISPSISRKYKRWAGTILLGFLTRPHSSEFLYTFKLSKEFGKQTNKITLLFGSLSSDEIIRNNDFQKRQGKYIGLDCRFYRNALSSISISYLHNLKKGLNLRNRFSVSIQQSF